MSRQPIPTAVFLSGGGRTLSNLIAQTDLPIDIRLVISSSAKVRGVQIAKQAGIETIVVPKTKDLTDQSYCDAMFDPCVAAGIELVVMAGFLKHVMIPQSFENKVINIHPSLLPAFGGDGMYGSRVHQAAIDRGVQVSGCTVHYVDNQYDNGPIVLQKTCEVKPSDTADSLAARVFELECKALPEAIRMIADGELRSNAR
ncbi:Phosphoribosylglycinamide formyltransferase [Rubripirellula obstinata]|uniref:phosphoribosylglycinamide formyltransferase 1 n=1 Tax=Rubripirellula obstinata TaxID=406547 RepID=A0A5B1CG43_9BACT|nr:phosphoribosylglycinamide formyltransferase [Rubripirellula obstinata]KAA1258895.1 Phosphoribosylglycinamide formyltransferase [Rubripirellula obstinata]